MFLEVRGITNEAIIFFLAHHWFDGGEKLLYRRPKFGNWEVRKAVLVVKCTSHGDEKRNSGFYIFVGYSALGCGGDKKEYREEREMG